MTDIPRVTFRCHACGEIIEGTWVWIDLNKSETTHTDDQLRRDLGLRRTGMWVRVHARCPDSRSYHPLGT